MKREITQLVVIIFFVVAVINVTGLARTVPTTTAVVLRNGVLLKGSGEKIYLLEDGKKRWIYNLDAFEGWGYRWEQVQFVPDSLLESLPDGRPLYLLVKGSGEKIYLLDQGQKRWIRTLEDFKAQGFLWEDVKIISDAELRVIPEGTPIPP
ncbi:MAG: hypothetical protein ACE5NP_12870 [Anaerolineae bacterium]